MCLHEMDDLVFALSLCEAVKEFSEARGKTEIMQEFFILQRLQSEHRVLIAVFDLRVGRSYALLAFCSTTRFACEHQVQRRKWLKC